MNTLCLKVVLALYLALPGLTMAQEASFGMHFVTCMEKSGGLTQSMLECLGAETRRQDMRLNKSYQALAVSLGPERRKQLQEAQRAWIRFRDINCNFYMDPEGGSMARVRASECVMKMTAERANELEGLSP